MTTQTLGWTGEIPSEIRLMVYDVYFTSLTVNIHKPTCRNKPGDCLTSFGARLASQYQIQRQNLRSTNSALSLFLTCKLVHEEAEPLLFEKAQFVQSACFNPSLRSTRGTPAIFSNVAQRYLQKVANFLVLLGKRPLSSAYDQSKWTWSHGFTKVRSMTHVVKYPLLSVGDETFLRRLMKLSLDHVHETEFFLYETDWNASYNPENVVKITISFDNTMTVTTFGGGRYNRRAASAVRFIDTVQDGLNKRRTVPDERVFDVKLVETDDEVDRMS